MKIVDYIEKDSILHRMDPRLNILLSLTLILLAFLFTDPLYLFTIFVFVVILSFLAKVHREFFSWLKLLVPFALLSFVLWTFFAQNSLSVETSEAIANFGPLTLTQTGILYGLGMPFRILVMITTPLLFMMTVRNSHLIKALEHLKVPYKVAFGIGLVFRMIYVFEDEMRDIRQAQKSRGAMLDRGNLLRRVKSNISVLIPTMIKGLETSDDLSTAMELKGFSNSHNRNSIRKLELSRTDMTLALICFSIMGAMISLRFFGFGTI